MFKNSRNSLAPEPWWFKGVLTHCGYNGEWGYSGAYNYNYLESVPNNFGVLR